MTITPVGVSHMRYQVMDFSSPMFMDETIVVYTRPTPEADVTGFIKPYTTWVSVEITDILYCQDVIIIMTAHVYPSFAAYHE